MKTWRDLWKNRSRSVLVILSISLSTFTLGVILNSYAILSREMTRDYLESNPTAISFSIDRFESGLLRSLQSNENIDKVDARRVITGDIKTQNGDWKPLYLYVLNDYNDIKLDVLRPEQGSWPPQNNQILIERQAVSVLGADIGEQIQLKTTSGLSSNLTMSGTTHDVGLAQAEWENVVYGYISAKTLQKMGGELYFNQLKVSLTSAANGLPKNRQKMALVADEIKAWLEKHNYSVAGINIASPGRHPHANITDGMFMIQKVFAVLCCLLSAVLVFNLMSAMLSKHLSQIGLMKAIGASTKQISHIYYRGVILLGIIGMLISLPLSSYAAILYVDMLLPMMNFNIESYQVPFWVLFIEMGVGIGIPILAALVPIKQASRLSIRETFLEFSKQEKYRESAFERFVFKLTFFSPAISLAIRNSIRNRARFILTMVVLAFAATLLMATFNITRTMDHAIAVEKASKNWGLEVKFKQNMPTSKITRFLEGENEFTHYEAFYRARAAIIEDHEETAEQDKPHKLLAALTKLEPNSIILNMPIISGRWLSNEKNTNVSEVVVSQVVLKKMPELTVGMNINIETQGTTSLFKVVGIVRNIGEASLFINNTIDLTSGIVLTNGLFIKTDETDESSLKQFKKQLTNLAEQRGVGISFINTAWRSVYVVKDHFNIIFYLMLMLTLVVIFIASNGIMLTMMTNTIERTRETGVLKAIGAGNNELSKMVFSEAFFIGLLSWLVGCIMTLPVSFIVAYSLGILLIQTPFELVLNPMIFVYSLPIIIFIAAIASLMPMKSIMKMPIRNALIHE